MDISDTTQVMALDELADLMIKAKAKTGSINDPELDLLVDDVLIRLGKLLAKRIVDACLSDKWQQ